MVVQARSEEDRKNVVEQGFTLVELLIVIVILGILAGIVVFAVGNLTSNAKSNSCATEKSEIQAALEAYKAQVGSYPTAAQVTTAGASKRIDLLDNSSYAPPSVGVLLKTAPADYDVTDDSGTITAISNNPGNCS